MWENVLSSVHCAVMYLQSLFRGHKLQFVQSYDTSSYASMGKLRTKNVLTKFQKQVRKKGAEDDHLFPS